MTNATVSVWTRKLHNYLALFLLLFLWLFSLSGLVLNHPQWELARFWQRRVESQSERLILRPDATADAAIALSLMRQLGIAGEVTETRRSPRGDGFHLQVVKPGRVFRVAARFDSSRARITEIRLNAWGAVDALHKFTGVRMDDPAQRRDWMLTRIWSLAIDGLAVGIVILVLSGLYLWLRRTGKRWTGLLAFGLGMGCAAFFVYGLGALLG